MKHLTILFSLALQTAAIFREGIFYNIPKDEATIGNQQNTSAETSMECGIE